MTVTVRDVPGSHSGHCITLAFVFQDMAAVREPIEGSVLGFAAN